MNHPSSKPRTKFYHLRNPERVNLDTFICYAQISAHKLLGWETITDQEIEHQCKGDLIRYVSEHLTVNPEAIMLDADGALYVYMTYQEDLEYPGDLIIPARLPELTLPNGMQNAAARLHYFIFEE